MKEVHKKVKEITDRKRGIKTSSGCIKDRNGRVLFDKKEVAKRWVEYIKELYEDEIRDEKVDIKVDGTTLEQVETFKYLGQTITSDGRSKTAIRQRIEVARQTFLNMSDV